MRRLYLLENNRIAAKTKYEDLQFIRKIEERKWIPEEKIWAFPLKKEIVEKFKEHFGDDIVIDQNVYEALEKLEQEKIKVFEMEKKVLEEYVPTKTAPMNHQVQGVARAVKSSGFAFFFEQGTGKTKTTIDTITFRFLHDGLRRVLVIAPKSVLYVWPAEFEKHSGIENADVRVLEGSKSRKREQLLSWGFDADFLQVAVTNYDFIRDNTDVLSAWLYEARKRGYTAMTVLDEAHKIKDLSTKQSKAAHSLAEHSDFRLVLTGTPVVQGPQDYYSIMRFVDKNIFPFSFHKYISTYARKGGYMNREIVDWPKLPKIIEKISPYAFRVTKKEALDLPPEMDTVVPVELSDKARKLYEQIRKSTIVRLSESKQIRVDNVLVELLRLQQVTGGFLDDKMVDTSKLEVLDDLLETLLCCDEKKAVIFARFTSEIEAIHKLLEERNIEHVCLHGKTPQGQRGEIVERFQSDPKTRVFLSQIQAGGLGLTLTAADTMIFYSTTFSLADYEQAKSRISRMGQTADKITYVHLLARNTIDEKIYRALKEKQNIADLAVNRWRELLDAENTNKSEESFVL